MAKRYALIFGVMYGVVALLEIIFREPFGGLLHFSLVHNAIHWVTVAALLFAFVKGDTVASLVAKIIGAVFLLVFILGVAAPAFLSDTLGYPVNWFYNIVHLVTGIGGLYAGFLEKKSPPPPAIASGI